MARGLGWTFRDSRGAVLPEGGGALADLAALGGGWSLSARVTGLADVTTPLVGADGAALVFGPQKGATPEGVRRLAQGLERLAQRAADHGRPDLATLSGGGTAGGLGAGLVFFAKGQLMAGARWGLSPGGVEPALATAGPRLPRERHLDPTSPV